MGCIIISGQGKELNGPKMQTEKMKEILEDAGVDEKTLERYLECRMDSSRLSVLASARRNLLEAIHMKNEQLRILDYLIYNLKTKGEK